jgi:hypothetical protein
MQLGSLAAWQLGNLVSNANQHWRSQMISISIYSVHSSHRKDKLFRTQKVLLHTCSPLLTPRTLVWSAQYLRQNPKSHCYGNVTDDGRAAPALPPFHVTHPVTQNYASPSAILLFRRSNCFHPKMHEFTLHLIVVMEPSDLGPFNRETCPEIKLICNISLGVMFQRLCQGINL